MVIHRDASECARDVRIHVVGLVAILLCAGVATPQADVKQIEEILTAEARWINAICSGDSAALEKILSDDLVYTHTTGVVHTKKEFIQKFRSGVQTVEYSDRKIQLFGNTAVLTAQMHIRGEAKGQTYDNRVRIIHVWPAWTSLRKRSWRFCASKPETVDWGTQKSGAGEPEGSGPHSESLEQVNEPTGIARMG